MDVMSRSGMNPNAPMFVPWAYQAVEDFSDEWWELVQSSAWFRDYWLQECFQEPENDLEFLQNDDPVLREIDAIFDGFDIHEEEKGNKEMVSLGSLKWRKPKILADPQMKNWEKAPKIVNVKVSPRMIQQPR